MGTIHETVGRVPALAALKKADNDLTRERCESAATSVNEGNGFQIPGVFALCCAAEQVICLSCTQSGSVPLNT